MNTKNKITILLIVMSLIMFILIVINIIYNFKSYTTNTIDKKAYAIAETIKHALTSQMITGVIQDRKLFLSQIENLETIDNIWLSRGESVIKEYGKGLENEVPRDDIDKKVLKTGKAIRIINDSLFETNTYRITIPYIASNEGRINCMNCHSAAKINDTLGAISITMSIEDHKIAAINTIVNIAVIAFLTMLFILILVNYVMAPILSIFDQVKKVMLHAQRGDYSHRIKNAQGKEAKEVASWVNGLLGKIQKTLDAIDSKISIFLSNDVNEEADHLINVKKTVSRLSDVYKFRKTIEHDETLEQIYQRLATVLKTKFGLDDFNFYECDTLKDSVTCVYIEKGEHCSAIQNGCRADRTNNIIESSQFQNLCPSCNSQKEYICIPFPISNELDLILSIYITDKEEAKVVRKNIHFIQDYIDASKTVIVSKKLLQILEKSANTDALTELYNRKFLEDSISKITAQCERSKVSFGVLMIDIDHFKMVNDTYGHDAGDTAIRVLAQTLLENIRSSDFAIRYGGEEFIILLYNCDEESVFNISENIRLAFSQKRIPAGSTIISKTISIGTSIFPVDNEDLNQCIKFADQALYEAKARGRNQTVTYQSIQEKLNQLSL